MSDKKESECVVATTNTGWWKGGGNGYHIYNQITIHKAITIFVFHYMCSKNHVFVEVLFDPRLGRLVFHLSKEINRHC